MSFWETNDGLATDTGTAFDGGGGGDLIPDKSSVLAALDKAEWSENRDGQEYINLQWRVQAPEALKNRVVFQKIWATDDKPGAKDPAAARDKAKRMLAAIDANAGGKLARKSGKPSDADLAIALLGKPMVIKVMTYGFTATDGSGKWIEGNWISSIAPKDTELKVGKEAAAKPAPAAKPQSNFDDLDDDVPF